MIKKIMFLIVIFSLFFLSGCKKEEVAPKGGIEVLLMGEAPSKGDLKITLYGYNKMLVDKKATVLSIVKTNIDKKKVYITIPEDSLEVITPAIKDKKNASFYLNIEAVDGDTNYFTDMSKKENFTYGAKSVEVYLKKR